MKRVILLFTVIAGCAETQSYVYAPDTTNAVAAGLPAERIAIPQEQPQGAVEVTSYGVTQLSPAHGQVRALHVRMVVTNDGDDAAWTLDTRQQLVSIAGEGQSRAVYVNSDVQSLPIVSIARHQRRVLDLYFPLPNTIRDAAQLPRFELHWQVTTPARTVASRAEFDRVKQENEAYGYAAAEWPYWAGYGPYWWYDPFFPRFAFVHARPIVIDHHRGHVGVGRFEGRFRPVGGARAGGAHVSSRGHR